MDVQPHHNVLDTCASPGSKTAQLIEALHRNTSNPSGLVIANDSDYKRSHMLTHQIKRLNSANVVVVNHDAQLFPNIKIGEKKYLKFDRILCDVPCSGDGTMRKNVNVWKDWTVGNGLGLHTLQVNIATRGVQMLKPGGRLVYSTCSLNPVENEAVVAQLLRTFPKLKLVDTSDELPGLVRSPGVSDWKIQDKEGNWPQKEESALAGSVFPPTEDEKERFKLERTIRIYPHQQDTGGFFVAVLEKESAEARPAKKARVDPSVTEEAVSVEFEAVAPMVTPVAPAVGDGSTEGNSGTSTKGRGPTEDPFHFLSVEDATVSSCFKFYGINPEFPRDTMVVRNSTGEPVRTIYYVSPVVRPIIELNEQKVRFINAGIKMFAHQKNEGDCKWRVQSEGVGVLRPYLGEERLVRTSNEATLRYLCENEFTRFADLETIDKELHSQVIERGEGCCLWDIQDQIYALWRGRGTVSLMLSKENREELLLRVFGVMEKKTPKITGGYKAAEAEGTSEDSQAKEEFKGSETKEEVKGSEAKEDQAQLESAQPESGEQTGE